MFVKYDCGNTVYDIRGVSSKMQNKVLFKLIAEGKGLPNKFLIYKKLI